MVSYRSNERNAEIVERLEKLEARLEDLESRVRYNKIEEKSKVGVAGFAPKSFKTVIELSIHVVGLALMIIKYIQQIISPFTRTSTHTLASLLFLILSLILYRIWSARISID